jgi:hypothetical protein
LSSGPNTESGAKDTNSEEVARRVPKKIANLSGDSDLIQDRLTLSTSTSVNEYANVERTRESGTCRLEELTLTHVGSHPARAMQA